MKKKVAVGAFAGAFTIIFVWGLKQFAHLDVPTEVAQSGTVIFSTFISWLVPDEMEADA